MKIYRRESDGFEVQDANARDLAWVTATYGGGFVEIIPPTPTPAELCTAACLSRCQEVDALYSTKMFTDVTATFPTGDKVIQFRNNTDRSNLESVCAGATALITLGQSGTQMVYRTTDDVNQAVTAAQMAAIGLTVLAVKQAVTSKRWEHKDALLGIEADAAKTPEQKLIDIAGYDIQGGW